MKNLKKLSILLLSFSLISCSLPPPAIEVCGKLSVGAHCNNTVEDQPRSMTNAEWNQVGRISMSVKAWGLVKAYIKDSCNRSNKCKIKDESLMKEFFFDEAIK